MPLQGNAFAGIPCAGTAGTGMESHGRQAPPAAHHAMAASQHCADMAGVAAAVPANGGHDCAGHDGGDAAESHGKCSQCASCCTGASAPPAMPSPVFPAAFSTVAPSAAEPAMIAHVPATPKRPPRHNA
ncbi:hypothetical protein ASD15_10665 [Massilia sp. Root351]|nr:hypothetical protein ASD15_10665 [Massilia sp. Root351]